MPQAVRNLRITRVATVKAGANQHARILLWKGMEGAEAPLRLVKRRVEEAVAGSPDPLELAARLARALPLEKGAGADAYNAAIAGVEAQEQVEALQRAFWDTMTALRQAVWSVIDSKDIPVEGKAAAIREAMQTALDKLPDELAEEQAEGGGVEKSARTTPPAGAPGNEEDADVATLAEIEKKIADLEKAKNDEVTALTKRLEKAETENAALDAIAKGERERRIDAEFIAKAEKELPNVAGDPVTKGAMLRRATELAASTDPVAKAAGERELAFLRSADEQVRVSKMAPSGLYGAVGHSLGSPAGLAKTNGAGSALAEYPERLAKARREHPDKPASELARIVMADPEYATRYDREMAVTEKPVVAQAAAS